MPELWHKSFVAHQAIHTPQWRRQGCTGCSCTPKISSHVFFSAAWKLRMWFSMRLFIVTTMKRHLQRGYLLDSSYSIFYHFACHSFFLKFGFYCLQLHWIFPSNWHFCIASFSLQPYICLNLVTPTFANFAASVLTTLPRSEKCQYHCYFHCSLQTHSKLRLL